MSTINGEHQSLEDLLTAAGDPVSFLRNSQAGPNVYPGVPAEYTNWRDEQWAWQHSAVLFNQSYHMADLYVRGGGALELLKGLGINTFENFAVDKAKQFVPVSPDGYVIGDVILFHLAEHEFNLVGRAPVLNWVTYHAQKSDLDVEVELDQRSALRTDGKRKAFRYQVQGPNAMDLIRSVLGQDPPDLKFFNMTEIEIAGVPVRALRHGMVGQPGWELFGDWEHRDTVHQAIVEAGKDFGLRLSGGRAYSSNALESAWVPSPLPAVYQGDELKAYREWLPATGYEGTTSIGGSFVSDEIEDYYFTPWDLNYGHIVKFDHDFIGADALKAKVDGPHRQKVTLHLNDEDVARTIGTLFGDPDRRAKFFDWPSAVYAMHPMDRVHVDGETVGVSTWVGYSSNEAKMLTLAILDADYATPGTEVTFVWGEEDGGTKKPTVEPHTQYELRATVYPAPIVEEVRKDYAPGSWRAAALS